MVAPALIAVPALPPTFTPNQDTMPLESITANAALARAESSIAALVPHLPGLDPTVNWPLLQRGLSAVRSALDTIRGGDLLVAVEVPEPPSRTPVEVLTAAYWALVGVHEHLPSASATAHRYTVVAANAVRRALQFGWDFHLPEYDAAPEAEAAVRREGKPAGVLLADDPAADGDAGLGTLHLKASHVFHYAAYLLHAVLRARGLSDEGRLGRVLEDLRAWGYAANSLPEDPELEVDDIRAGHTRAWSIHTAGAESSDPPLPPPLREDAGLMGSARHAIGEAQKEIQRLRRRNEELEGRQQVIDFMIQLSRGPGGGGCATPDVGYFLQQVGERLTARIAPPDTVASAPQP